VASPNAVIDDVNGSDDENVATVTGNNLRKLTETEF